MKSSNSLLGEYRKYYEKTNYALKNYDRAKAIRNKRRSTMWEKRFKYWLTKSLEVYGESISGIWTDAVRNFW